MSFAIMQAVTQSVYNVEIKIYPQECLLSILNIYIVLCKYCNNYVMV